jgi:hypothetical protein
MRNEYINDIDFNELIKDYKITNLEVFALYLQDIYKVLYSIT